MAIFSKRLARIPTEHEAVCVVVPSKRKDLENEPIGHSCEYLVKRELGHAVKLGPGHPIRVEHEDFIKQPVIHI